MGTLFGLPNDDSSPSQKARIRKSAENTPDDWLVFFNVEWTDSTGQSDSDVVVVIPDRGIFYLEVKGGRITYSNRTWYQQSFDYKSQRYLSARVINPFAQATQSQAALDKWISSKAGIRVSKQSIRGSSRIPSYWGLWFCSTSESESSEIMKWTAAKNAPMVFESDLTASLQQFPTISPPLSTFELENITRSLAPKIGIGPASAVLYTATELEQYSRMRVSGLNSMTTSLVATRDQENALRQSLSGDTNQLVITGPAGSGKTLLAASMARTLADRGKEVLVTATNSEIVKFLEKLFVAYGPSNDAHVRFCTIGDMIESIMFWKMKNDGMTPEEIRSEALSRGVATPQFMDMNDVEPYLPQHADVVIVDEAQFLSVGYLKLFQSFGNFLVLFGDDHQEVNRTRPGQDEHNTPLKLSTIIDDTEARHIHLNENLRSTNSIWSAASRLSGVVGTNFQIAGIAPKFVSTLDLSTDQTTELIAGSVSEFNSIGLSNEQIMIVIVQHFENYFYNEDVQWQQRLMNFGIESHLNHNYPGIFLANPRSARGLERDGAIVVIESGSNPEYAYIALTRAKVALAVISNDSSIC
jgi:energy-coupling factor transporter ATP-binding protein EcfA2